MFYPRTRIFKTYFEKINVFTMKSGVGYLSRYSAFFKNINKAFLTYKTSIFTKIIDY